MLDMEALTREFSAGEIKRRKGRGGEEWVYVPVETVVKRLNEAFEGEWSFDIMEYKIQDEEVFVLGRLTAGGVSKCQFGGKKIGEFKEGGVISMVDDLKSAASDAVKKCAWLFGVGLEVGCGRNSGAAGTGGGDEGRNPGGEVHRRYFAMLPGCVRNKSEVRGAFEVKFGGSSPANKWDVEKVWAGIRRLSEAQKECARQKRSWQKLTVEELYKLLGISDVEGRDNMGDIKF